MYDSHCHLAGEEFEHDLPDVVERARAAGVRGALVILSAGDHAEAARAARVRDVWPEVSVSIGIHPHHAGQHAGDLDARIASLGEQLVRDDAVAVGEIGLDYHYDFAPRPIQQEVFRRQLRLARERGLPVVIHTREAADDTFDILEREGSGLRVVFHCFTGTRDAAERAIGMGAWLSFAGIVTFANAAELRDVVRIVPADRLLAETDAPYLTPAPFRGKVKRNEPSFVARTIEVIAEVRGEPVTEVREGTAANFLMLFDRGNPRRNNGLAR